MPLRTPKEVPTTSIAEIWAYTTRKMTDHEFEVEWNTEPLVNNITSLALENLTTHTLPAVDFVYPSGATEIRVIALASITAQAQADQTHHIGVKVQIQVNDGGWVDKVDLVANPPLGLPLGGAMGGLNLPIDITDDVASGNKVDFRFQVDSDNAGEVNYTTSFVVVLVYKMD